MSRLGRGFPQSTQVIPTPTDEDDTRYFEFIIEGGGDLAFVERPAYVITSNTAFGWATSITGNQSVPNATGTVASAFGWATAATAAAGASGAAASAFGWATAAAGNMAASITGTSAVAFGWSVSATAQTDPAAVAGTSAAVFGWGTSGVGQSGTQPVTGTSAAAFGWSAGALGIGGSLEADFNLYTRIAVRPSESVNKVQ